MFFLVLMLISAALQFVDGRSVVEKAIGLKSVTNLWPWKNVIPEAGYSKSIQLRFITKGWVPEGANIPEDQGILEKYPHPVDKAYEVLRNAKIYDYVDRPLDTAIELLSEEYGYRADQESIFILHTISGDAENYFVKNTAAALGMRNFMNEYNVFAFNMPDLQDTMENTVTRSSIGMETPFPKFKEAFGKFFDEAFEKKLMTPDQINLIGFCMSTQIASFIAHHIIETQLGQKIKSILGLDPYALGISPLAYDFISKHDAQYVHLFHTNSVAFGTLYRSGTADFTFNNGFFQPGCFWNTNFQCSHRRSVLLLWYIILYGDLFQARACYSYIGFVTCWCQSHKTDMISYPLNTKAEGTYILTTSEHRPYGYGVSGADCHAKHGTETVVDVANDIDFSKVKLF